MSGLTGYRRLLGTDQHQLREFLQLSMAQLDDVVHELRDRLLDLRVCDTAPSDLWTGLEELAAEARANGQLAVGTELDATAATAVPPSAVSHLLCIAREALSNVLRHANALHVAVRFGRDGDRLVLAVEDDGRGPGSAPIANSGGQGLRNMAERARELNGRLTIARPEGGGMTLRVELPTPADGEG
jgi:signal transduction histidine kinase